jgi:CHAT domain-containing protein
MRRARRSLAGISVILLAMVPAALPAAVLQVPAGHPTIKSAVERAAEGDIVLVADGVYLEKNIVVAKDITIRSKNPYGAVIYGSPRTGDAIFIVQAAARIEGFVLRNSAVAVEQRDSPDVRWEASDLALFDCLVGLSVNDPEANVGSAVIRRVAIFGPANSSGISTNDAGRVEASGCLVVGCDIAFQGYDHLSFTVRDSLVIDCAWAFDESTSHRPVPPATSRIVRDAGVRAFDSASLRDPRRFGEVERFLGNSLFPAGAGGDERSPFPSKKAFAALVRGLLLASAGRAETAGESFLAARAAAERAGAKELVWRSMAAAARLAADCSATDEALARYEEAAAFLEAWLPDLAVGIYRIDFLDEKMPVFEALIRLCLEKDRAAPGGGWNERAFLCAERAKRVTSRFRAGISRAPGRGLPASRATAGEITALQIALSDPDLSASEKEKLVARLESAEEEHHAALVEAELNEGGPAPSGRDAGASPIGFREAKDRLGDGALLSYVLGETASYAFLASDGGLESAVLPDGRTIATAVERYLRFLRLGDGREFRGAGAGALLFDTLIGPFADRLGTTGRTLIVVPDGLLRYLPFETLVRADKGASGDPEFLGNMLEISYAASATEALFLPERTAEGARPDGVLAVGCSIGVACDNRSRGKKLSFLRLRHVAEEIARLERALRGRSVTAVLGSDASEARLKSAGLDGFAVIHIAAHGVLDDESWWRSALLLKPGPDGAEDGYLTALEVPGLGISARLVVLSGCETGSGRLFGGAGIRGLSRAFLRAGAESVLVSLWNVDDKATAAFMERFYAGLGRGDPPGRALAAAKRGMMRSGYRNPYYWAPFVLIGRSDGRALFDDEAP